MSLRWCRACRPRKRVVAELGGDGWVKCPACWASWGDAVDRREVFGERPLRYQELTPSARLSRSGWHVESGGGNESDPARRAKG